MRPIRGVAPRWGPAGTWLAVITGRLPGGPPGTARWWVAPAERSLRPLILQEASSALQELAHLSRSSPMLSDREGYPSLQRPHRPARADQRAGRACQQSALVLAPRHAGPVRRNRPEALGRGQQGTRQDALCAIGLRAPGPCLGRGFRGQGQRGGRGSRDLPEPPTLVPELGCRGRGWRTRLDRLLQP